MTVEATESRPLVDLDGGDLARMVDEAWQALVAANDSRFPRVLVRGNELVRMTERGELEPYNAHSLRDEMSRTARFWHSGSGSASKPPRDLADVLLNRDSAEYVGAPRVER